MCHKKQKAENDLSVQYRVGAQGNDTYDIRANLIKDLLTEIYFLLECPMKLYGNNKIAIQIAENAVFHKRTKHI